jgi:hypothetical protein
LTGWLHDQHAVTAASRSASMRRASPTSCTPGEPDGLRVPPVSSVATMSTLWGDYLQSDDIPDWPGRQPVQGLKADVDNCRVETPATWQQRCLALCFVPAELPPQRPPQAYVSEGGSTGSPEQLTPWAETA